MAAKQVATAAPAWRKALAKWAFNRSYFNQLGLMRDDTLEETPVVEEALKRLPKDLYDERSFRISRAFLLSTRKDVLPKEEWTQYESDVQYLQPYIMEVAREMAEKKEWNKR